MLMEFFWQQGISHGQASQPLAKEYTTCLPEWRRKQHSTATLCKPAMLSGSADLPGCQPQHGTDEGVPDADDLATYQPAEQPKLLLLLKHVRAWQQPQQQSWKSSQAATKARLKVEQ